MADHVPYHRSNLREALLNRAVVVLEERGAAELSLRELARDVGVSHAAPARHFADRRQLLEALALEGFRLLEIELRDAISTHDDPYEQARAVAASYIDFTVSRVNIAELMFRHDAGDDRGVIGERATGAFQPLLQLFQEAEGAGLVDQGEAAGAATLFLATLQGTAALVNCGVVEAEAVSGLIDTAVPRFVARHEGRRMVWRSQPDVSS